MVVKSKTDPLSFRSNLIWNTSGTLVYNGCLWAITILVVTLSPNYDNSGVLAYAMAIGNMYMPFAQYNTRTLQVSDVDNRFNQQNFFAFRIGTCLASFVFFSLYTIITTINSIETVLVVVAFLLFKMDESFAVVCYASEQKADRMDYIGRSQLIRGVFCLTFFTAAVYTTQNLLIAILLMFISCVFVTVFYDVPRARLFGEVKPKISKETTLTFLKMCLPSVISSTLCGAVVSIARQIFGLEYGDSALGIYATVSTPAVLVQMAVTFLYSPLLTKIAREWHYNKKHFVSYISKIFLLMIIVIIALLVICNPIGQLLLPIVFGDSISEYVYLFPATLVISGLIALMWFSIDVMMILRNIKMVLLPNAISFIAMIICVLPFIRAFYMNGVNMAIIAAYSIGVILNLICIYYVVNKKKNYDKRESDE